MQQILYTTVYRKLTIWCRNLLQLKSTILLYSIYNANWHVQKGLEQLYYLKVKDGMMLHGAYDGTFKTLEKIADHHQTD